jgi:hypothetical protein
MAVQPLLPPRCHGPDGKPRRVGVELEFTGPDCRTVAGIARDLFGGRLEERDAYCFRVEGSELGDLTIELDMRAAHPSPDDTADGMGQRVKQVAHTAIGAVGSLLMPFEVAFPPLPIERLAEVDRLAGTLREHGAKGTRDRLLNAFGLHLNPEIAARDAAYLAAHLKAFALLAPWLREEIDMDLARRLSPYTRPYPDAYVRLLADPAYRPDLARLADDYLDANPTRDRELDMLPVLAELAPERVNHRIQGQKVKPRPAFHYRLPDSRVDEPGWGVAVDWNRWVAVERLAAEPERLAALGQAFLEHFAGCPSRAWLEELRQRMAR